MSSTDSLCHSLSGPWRSFSRAGRIPVLGKLFVMVLVVGAVTQGTIAAWLIMLSCLCKAATVGKMREVEGRLTQTLRDT